jgi:hypothetical protein
MQKTKNHYIKYTRLELENYTKLPESCVKKINCVEPIRFSPTIMSDFQSAILRILSKKIGKYDVKLNGIVLDFRNTKVLTDQSGIRQDSVFSVINVETNFYVFSPFKGAVVTGDLKYVNRLNMETVITVVIYRVFNVKVTVKGKVKQELEKNQEVKIRVKDFHFDNAIPYIEGELCKNYSFQGQFLTFVYSGEIVDTGIIIKSRKIFDDTIDSGISESSITSEVPKDVIKSIKIKLERESSVESTSPSTPREKVKKNRKRKVSSDSDSDAPPPSAKKVKTEPMTPVKEEEPIAVQRIKSEKISDSDDSTQRSAKKPKSNLPSTSKDSSKEKKSKKKKKKRNNDSDEDDFETSLQNLLNSAIKIRK